MKKVFKRITSLFLLTAMLIAFIPAFGANATDSQTELVWPVPGHAFISQKLHDNNAIDISDGSISGANIVAAMGGVVSSLFKCTENHPNSFGDCYGFGTGIVISGNDGKTYQYAHMLPNSIPESIKVGSKVSAGTVIGKVGNTGNSTGTHLHFGISNTSNYWDAGASPATYQYTGLPITVTVNKYSTVYSVGTTDAVIGATFNMSGTNDNALNGFDYYLLDEKGNTLAHKYETWNDVSGNVYQEVSAWCDTKSDLNYTLTPGTTYTITVSANILGDSYDYSESFKTKGEAPVVTKPFDSERIFEYGSLKSYIASNDAMFINKYTIKTGYFMKDLQKVGIELLDKNDKLLASKEEAPDHGDPNVVYVWYFVKDELNYTLTPGTDYKYRFYGVYNGTKYYDDAISFTTLSSTVTLSEIAVASLPAKTIYEIGESLNTSGLTLKATYSDGSTKTITSGFTTSVFSSSTAGKKTVTVTYEDKTTTFTVSVVAPIIIEDDNPQMVIESKTARVGEIVTLPVELKNVTSLKSIALSEFTYDDSALELVSGEWKISDCILQNWNPANQTAAIAFTDNCDVNGAIFALTFKVKDDTEDGDYSVCCSITAKTRTTSGAEETVYVPTVSGSINVISVIRGDVNGDNLVTSDDAIQVLYYTLLPDIYTVNQEVDFNGDGLITSDDAIYLLYYTLLPELYSLH